MKTNKLTNLSSWTLFLVLSIFTGALTFIAIYANEVPDGKDFIAFWGAAKLSVSGQPEAAYNKEEMKKVVTESSTLQKSFSWLYPPTYQALTYPLGYISYKSAFSIFVLGSALIFMSLLIFFCKKEHRIIMLSCPALFICILFGQNSMLTASLGLIAISTMRKNQKISGIAMGLLSIKPHLMIVLPLLAIIEKRWAAIAWATITSLLLITYSLLIFGKAPWYSFFENTNHAVTWLQDGTLIIDLMTSITANMLLFGASYKLSLTLHCINILLILVLNYLIFRKTNSIELRAAAAIILLLNISPYMFTYELTWLSVAVLFILKHGKFNMFGLITIIIAWSLPLLSLIQNAIYQKSFDVTFILSYMLLISILTVPEYKEPPKA